MKILLVRSRPDKASVGLHNLMTCEPLELEYAAATLKKNNNHDVYLVDLILEKKDITHFIDKYKPDMVGFTSYITHVNVVKNNAKIVKSRDKKIITFVGGVHCEVVPDDYIDENIDYILGKNGLKNLEILCEAIRDNEKPHFYNRSVDFLYKLPLPDRDITKKYRKYYNYAVHSPCALIKTSFGCPYQCCFCFCREITDNKYYERPMHEVIDEIMRIKEDNIFIVDDNFLVNEERVLQFCDLLKTNDIRKKFIIFGRADFIVKHPAALKKLKECGLEFVIVGIESFRQKDLLSFNKMTDVKNNEEAIKILHDYKIDCYAGIIVGPDWSIEDFKEFTAWLKKTKIKFINIQPLIPLPGTEIYHHYKDKLIFSRNNFAMWDLTHVVILPKEMSVARYYIEIVRAYFKSMFNIKTFIYTIRRYGIRPAMRSMFGTTYIFIHYVKLILKSLYGKKDFINPAHYL